MIDWLVNVAPCTSRVLAANEGEALMANMPARHTAMTMIAATWTELSSAELRLAGVRLACDPERRPGKPRLITAASPTSRR